MEPPNISSPEVYELGERSQLGSLEAVYRINTRASMIFWVFWSVFVLLCTIVFIVGNWPLLPFFAGHVQMPILFNIMAELGSFGLIPFFMLSVGIAGIVITLRQKHTRLSIYTKGLLLQKRPHVQGQVVFWAQIDHVRRYTTRGRKGSVRYHYDIICRNGHRLSFGKEYTDYWELFETLDRMVVREYLPDVLARYQQGQFISFGRYLALDRDGIHVSPWHPGSYSWTEIDSIQFDDFALSFFLNSRSKPIQLFLERIDNVCLLRALMEQV